MSLAQRIKDHFDGLLGKTMLLIFGIIVTLFVIYALTWIRSGHTYDDLQVHHPQFHLETTGTDSTQKVFYVDEFRAGKMQIHPTLAHASSIDRLVHQLGLIRMRGFHHQNYYIFFYRMRYGLSIIQAFASLFALVLGLLITREGWSNANRMHLVTFFVFTAFAALLQLIPESLQLERNIETNVSQYERHKSLEQEVLTYLSTGLAVDEHPMDVPGYVIYIDKQMNKIQKISLTISDFPAEKIQERFSELEEQLKANQSAEKDEE